MSGGCAAPAWCVNQSKKTDARTRDKNSLVENI
jgi:hypothetical protein